MSQRTSRNPGCSIRCSTFSGEPVRKLSRHTTSTPRSSRCSQRCDPRKPAPPVTTARPIVRASRTGLRCDIAAPLPVARLVGSPRTRRSTGDTSGPKYPDTATGRRPPEGDRRPGKDPSYPLLAGSERGPGGGLVDDRLLVGDAVLRGSGGLAVVVLDLGVTDVGHLDPLDLFGAGADEPADRHAARAHVAVLGVAERCEHRTLPVGTGGLDGLDEAVARRVLAGGLQSLHGRVGHGHAVDPVVGELALLAGLVPDLLEQLDPGVVRLVHRR